MLRDKNKTETNTICYHLYAVSLKIKQMYLTKQTDSQIQRTNQWRRREGQDRGRGLRGINHYVYNI